MITDTTTNPECIGPQEVLTLFLEIIDLFVPNNETDIFSLRLRLALDTPFGIISVLNFHSNADLDEIRNNISNLSPCTKSDNTPIMRESSAQRVSDFIARAFSEEQGSRANASRVAVVLMGVLQPEAAAVKTIQAGNSDNDIETLIIIIGPDEIYKTDLFPNTISVTGFSHLIDNQLISMALCKKCRKDWFLFEHRNPFYYMSCYYLDIDKSALKDWYHALDRCDKMSSSLASVETYDEIGFLEKALHDALAKQGDSNVKWEIFIGLISDRESLTGHFKWLSGHPLVMSLWLDKRAHGGLRQECGIWKYQIPEVQQDKALNFSEYTRNYKNGWVDIACGRAQSHTGICEVSLERFHGDTKMALDILPANNESFSSALHRGEFVEFNGKIVSVSAFSGDFEFYGKFNVKKNGLRLFQCDTNDARGTEIAYSYVCDYVHQCPNKRDEEVCLYRKCDSRSEFECRSHQCVPLESRCDLYPDCFDGSDEEGCIECKQKQCCDAICMPKHRCNEQLDCVGCLGREARGNRTILPDSQESCSFICNRISCVYPSQLGDGVLDCIGPEGPLDETLGKLPRVSCATDDEIDAWAPLCIYYKDRYNEILGCRDLSHLWNCASHKCPEGYAKCTESYCIPLHLIRDGNMDCPLGEDENYSKNSNCSGNFACWDSDICLHPDLVCNGNPDCPSRDDELNCNVTCRDGFWCLGGSVTVSNYSLNVPLPSLAFIDHRTRYLDLSGVNVTLAFAKVEKRNLRNLNTIVLSNCKITTVEETFSSDVSNLQSVYSLDITKNRFSKVHTKSIFRFMTNLHVLKLSYNSALVVLEANAFLAYNKRSTLEFLDLSYTSIYELHSSVLYGLVSLKTLDLSHTKISHLYISPFPSNFKLRFLYLRGTSIQGYNASYFNGLTIEEGFYSGTYGLCCPQIRGPGITEQVCFAPEDAISTCYDLIGDPVQRVLLWMVGIIAVVGNFTVIVCRFVWNKGVFTKAYGIFVTNLGASDFIMGVYLLTIAFANSYYKGIYITNNLYWKQSLVCHIAGFLSTLSSETSAFFVLLVTIDRYFVLKFPFGQFGFSRRVTVIVSVLSWSCGFALALVPSLPNFNNWTIFYANGMCLGLPLTVERLGGWEYSVAIFVGLNTIMFLVIAAGQYSIYKAMSGNRAAKTAVQNSNRRSQDIKVAKQLFLVVLTDFLCYFPVGLMGLLAMTGHEVGNDVYAWSAVLVLPINSAINPVLYTVPVIQNRWLQFRRLHLKHGLKKEKSHNTKAVATLSRTIDYNLRNNEV